MAENDFTDDLLHSRESWSALHSPSQEEANRFSAEVENEQFVKGQEFYDKQESSPALPVPSRYDYNQVDNVDQLPLRNFRAQQQFFAGHDVTTGVKEQISVTDPEPGWMDNGLDSAGKAFGRLVDNYSSSMRTIGGAGVKATQATQHLGTFMAELAADAFGPAMDEDERQAYWEQAYEENVMSMPGFLEAEGATEAVAQELFAFLTPYIGLTKMAGVYKMARAGKMVPALMNESAVAAVMAQGYHPKEGNLSTTLREIGFDNAFTEFMDSKQSYEQGDVMLARTKTALEEVGLTFAFPLVAGFAHWARSQKKANTVKSINDVVGRIHGNSVKPDGTASKKEFEDLVELAYHYLDDGAGPEGFLKENAGVYNDEVMQDALTEAMFTTQTVDQGRRNFLTGFGTAAAVAATAGPAALMTMKQADEVVAPAAKAITRSIKPVTGTLAEVGQAFVKMAQSPGGLEALNLEGLVSSSLSDLSKYSKALLGKDVSSKIASRLGGIGKDEHIVHQSFDEIFEIDGENHFTSMAMEYADEGGFLPESAYLKADDDVFSSKWNDAPVVGEFLNQDGEKMLVKEMDTEYGKAVAVTDDGDEGDFFELFYKVKE